MGVGVGRTFSSWVNGAKGKGWNNDVFCLREPREPRISWFLERGMTAALKRRVLYC